VIPEVIICTASKALPVKASTQPWFLIPSAFHSKQGAFFIRQCDNLIGLRVRCRVISDEDMGQR
jgi:hypothetical protein